MKEAVLGSLEFYLAVVLHGAQLFITPPNPGYGGGGVTVTSAPLPSIPSPPRSPPPKNPPYDHPWTSWGVYPLRIETGRDPL